MQLVYIGMNATVNVPRILDEVRQKYPLLKEHELHELARIAVEQSLAKRPPRYQYHVVNLYGADCLSAEPQKNMQNWRWMEPIDRHDLLAIPVNERKERFLDRFEPTGLEHSYTWRHENNWTQDVTPHDVDILRVSDARTWFVSQDRNWQPVRNFEYPIIETQTFTDAQEAKRYENDQKRVRRWKGA